MKRLLVALFLLSTALTAAEPTPQEALAVQQLVQRYYAAIGKEDVAAFQACMVHGDPSAAKLLFQSCDQTIRRHEIKKLVLSADRQAGQVHIHVEGTVKRFDGKDSYAVKEVFVGLLQKTADGWRFDQVVSEGQYKIMRHQLLADQAAQKVEEQALLKWSKGRDPVLARQCALASSVAVRLHTPVAGELEIALPVGTPLSSGDVIAYLGPEKKAEHYVAWPCAGRVAALLAQKKQKLAAGDALAGIEVRSPGVAYCFLRIGREETGQLAAAKSTAAACVALVQAQSGTQRWNALARGVARFEDPASEEVDILYAVSARQIPAWVLQARLGIGLFVPPADSRPSAPPAAKAVVMKLQPASSEWLQAQAKPKTTGTPAQPKPSVVEQPAARPALPAGMAYLHNAAKGLWVPRPGKWIDRSAQASGELIHQFVEKNQLAFAEVYHFSGEALTPEAFAGRIEARLMKSMANLKQRSGEEKLRIDGQPALLRTYKGEIKSRKTTTWLLYLPVKDQAFMVMSVVADGSGFEKVARTIASGARLSKP